MALPAGKCIIRITQDLAVRCGGEQSCLRPPARNGPSIGIWLFWSYGVIELWVGRRNVLLKVSETLRRRVEEECLIVRVLDPVAMIVELYLVVV